ncbi:hypothetical protein CsatA_017554 [Cannabis sativa]
MMVRLRDTEAAALEFEYESDKNDKGSDDEPMVVTIHLHEVNIWNNNNNQQQQQSNECYYGVVFGLNTGEELMSETISADPSKPIIWDRNRDYVILAKDNPSDLDYVDLDVMQFDYFPESETGTSTGDRLVGRVRFRLPIWPGQKEVLMAIREEEDGVLLYKPTGSIKICIKIEPKSVFIMNKRRRQSQLKEGGKVMSISKPALGAIFYGLSSSGTTLEKLEPYLENGKVKAVIDPKGLFPFANTMETFVYLETSRATRKVVIYPIP